MRRDGAANRDRILEAAERAFSTAGPSVSTAEIARRADVGIGTVFRHFPTKRELIEATATRYLHQLTAASDAASHDAPAGAAFAALFELLVARGHIKLALLDVLLTEGPDLPPPVRESVAAWHASVARRLEPAKRAGAVADDVTVDDVLLLVSALASPHLTAGPERDRAVALALRGLAAPTNAGLEGDRVRRGNAEE
jgi:AcrR family transcriptional regulator